MKVRNKLPRPLTIEPPGRDPIPVDANGEAEVDDELGKSLLRQPDRWEAVTAKPTKKAAKSGEEE